VLLQPVEWKALYCHTQRTTHLPKHTPSLQQTVLWIAMLGGYLNRKHDLPPGPTVIWRGFLLLHEIKDVSALQAKRIASSFNLWVILRPKPGSPIRQARQERML
jgi:hypothetical protein